MRCPHCLQNFHEVVYEGKLMVKKDYSSASAQVLSDRSGDIRYGTTLCPACSNAIIYLQVGGVFWTAYPKKAIRAPLPPEVVEEFAEDYVEASLVLSDSPKASAALSRRCLQH